MTLHIVIPVYNAARYLPDALNSLVSECLPSTYKIKIVLVNDGSTDNSEGICLEYARLHPEIHYIYQQNQGVSVARNAGLQYIFDHCESSDWVGFLDADDIWHSGWAHDIEEGINADSNVIGFGMAFADSQLNINETKLPTRKILSGSFETSVSENRWFHFDSYIYKCSYLAAHKIAFIPKVTNGEDLIFKYEVFLFTNKLSYYPSPLYVYRKNEHSVTSNYTRDAVEYYEVLFMGWYGFLNWLTAVVTDPSKAGHLVLAAVVVHHIGEASVHLEDLTGFRGEPAAPASLRCYQLPLGGHKEAVSL